ncbi:MAG: lipid kinase [Gemmataceae bacterium]
MARRAIVILNHTARNAGVHKLLAKLGAIGWTFVDPHAARPPEIAKAIRERQPDVEAVIVAGGDGTCSAAADALVESQLPMGLLPYGTANDLARTLNIPLDPAAAMDVIVAGSTRRIDLGWVNGKYFFNAASLGLAVKITRQLRREHKSRWGVFAYAIAASKMLIKARPFRAEIIAGDQSWRVKTVQIAIGNGRHYGGGMTIHEDARIDDGLLDLHSLEVKNWWQLLPLVPALRHGTTEKSARIRTLRGTEFTIRPVHHQRTISADGELVGHTPATFRVVPQCLSVFAPVSPQGTDK